MSNEDLQRGLRQLRAHGVAVSMSRAEAEPMVTADGYDEHGNVVFSATATTRKAALARLIDDVRHRRPELLVSSAPYGT